MLKSKQEMIDDIMDNFDFGRVAKCMEALNWKWISVPEGIPDCALWATQSFALHSP